MIDKIESNFTREERLLFQIYEELKKLNEAIAPNFKEGVANESKKKK
jgi:hypothetical protein